MKEQYTNIVLNKKLNHPVFRTKIIKFLKLMSLLRILIDNNQQPLNEV